MGESIKHLNGLTIRVINEKNLRNIPIFRSRPNKYTTCHCTKLYHIKRETPFKVIE